ncbi:hypothetical protein XENOCAPTIV_000430 [Xenoophorus captivus]|uniref:DAAF9 CobW C-like domain-containing protein n=1 Tax=Xenoophorus captivus TaxID=1517983 RepID=A0ABV0RW25_9TELE
MLQTVISLLLSLLQIFTDCVLFSFVRTVIVTQQRIAFSRPLERPLFVSRCKAIRSSLKPSPFRGNVYNIWGKVRFSDSDRAMDVFYNAVSGTLSIVPDQSTDSLTAAPKETSTPCFLIFDGVGLIQDELKVWLRLCTKQVGIILHSSVDC